jgi:hypothetical protein
MQNPAAPHKLRTNSSTSHTASLRNKYNSLFRNSRRQPHPLQQTGLPYSRKKRRRQNSRAETDDVQINTKSIPRSAAANPGRRRPPIYRSDHFCCALNPRPLHAKLLPRQKHARGASASEAPQNPLEANQMRPT